jgi:hypothetical protein
MLWPFEALEAPAEALLRLWHSLQLILSLDASESVRPVACTKYIYLCLGLPPEP